MGAERKSADRKTGKHGAASVSRSDDLPFAPVETVRDRAGVWRRRLATIFTGCLAMVMGYGVVFGHNGLTAFAHKREEARSLAAQTEQLKRENERLRGHVERLQRDPAAIEHEARENLHYTRAGEVIVTLPNAAPKPVPNPKGK